ncbi:MAG TPA: hypothetical protein VGW39_11465 [Chthoniobacterales bacterium]|nr:hypothetical protein [Chthoniobacterales bacterium]
MKRFQLLVMVAAIAAALIWWGFYRSHHTSSAAVSSLLPKETLALIHLPDFNRSRAELHQTDIYKIWTEPAVQDFLQKPRARIPANRGLGSAIQECESLQMKDAFLAVIAIEHSAWKIVGGFRFKGDPGNAEKIVANWKAQLLGKAPDFKQEIVNYQGHQIQADTAGIVRLSTVRHGQWFFVANDPEQLKPLLDRVDGRLQDSHPALAEDDVFAAASKRMPSSYTALAFARVNQLVEKLMPRGETGAEDSTDQMAAIRQIRSVCGATSFEGGKIRDVIFIGMPQLLDAGILTRASLPIATKDAFLYAAGFLNLTNPAPLSSSHTALGWMAGLQKITSALSSHGLTLEDWNRAFGPEFSWIGNWPSNSHWPSFFAALPVKDLAQANKILIAMTTANADSPAWTRQEKDGVQYFSTRTGGQLFSFSPTLGLSDRMLVAGADAASVEAAMKRSTGSSELAASKNFTHAERVVPAAQQAFAYIDPALIYTRVDATLRPMLFMGAAFLPGIADTVDLNKLPAPETITKHLSPIVMSQRYDGDGYISESVGPVTVYQTIVGVAGLGGTAAALYRRQTSGASNSSRPPAIWSPPSSPLPAPSPLASPSPVSSPDASPE